MHHPMLEWEMSWLAQEVAGRADHKAIHMCCSECTYLPNQGLSLVFLVIIWVPDHDAVTPSPVLTSSSTAKLCLVSIHHYEGIQGPVWHW